MVTGLALRLTRESAARYSFLMASRRSEGPPSTRASTSPPRGCRRLRRSPSRRHLSAALSGFAGDLGLLAYLRRHDFTPFVLYRLAVGVGALALIVLGVRSALGV